MESRKAAYADMIRRELETKLGRWFIEKMEEMLEARQLHDERTFRPLTNFVRIWGAEGDAYFVKK
jgi:Arc/MetJ family transcription regulator